jgi:hypothetical protein
MRTHKNKTKPSNSIIGTEKTNLFLKEVSQQKTKSHDVLQTICASNNE